MGNPPEALGRSGPAPLAPSRPLIALGAVAGSVALPVACSSGTGSGGTAGAAGAEQVTLTTNLGEKKRGGDVRSHLPWAVLGGVALLTVCDLIGRTVVAPPEIPASVILGAVVFLSLILRRFARGGAVHA
ncbi:iron chelate uptake ABC transporter family permease subunit [Streptomyces sp. Tu 3180]|uniref:iron chelate uptake ABC transporter family permease subunit n=1 Tax=Streptomyces sp. Tu 3180 TaxID=2682611 RepID=UPI001FB76075|nr:iron chelate uptake ABC transporter family permease subunit [Streptomyces sp. Tu 3180]